LTLICRAGCRFGAVEVLNREVQAYKAATSSRRQPGEVLGSKRRFKGKPDQVQLLGVYVVVVEFDDLHFKCSSGQR
jgi:hypothetical protein